MSEFEKARNKHMELMSEQSIKNAISFFENKVKLGDEVGWHHMMVIMGAIKKMKRDDKELQKLHKLLSPVELGVIKKGVSVYDMKENRYCIVDDMYQVRNEDYLSCYFYDDSKLAMTVEVVPFEEGRFYRYDKR